MCASGAGGAFSTTPTKRLCRLSDSLGILPEQQNKQLSEQQVNIINVADACCHSSIVLIKNKTGSKIKIALEHETVKIILQRYVLFKDSFYGYRCIFFHRGRHSNIK